MSVLNPYEKFLDGWPLEVILTATPNVIAEFLEVLGRKLNDPRLEVEGLIRRIV